MELNLYNGHTSTVLIILIRKLHRATNLTCHILGFFLLRKWPHLNETLKCLGMIRNVYQCLYFAPNVALPHLAGLIVQLFRPTVLVASWAGNNRCTKYIAQRFTTLSDNYISFIYIWNASEEKHADGNDADDNTHAVSVELVCRKGRACSPMSTKMEFSKSKSGFIRSIFVVIVLVLLALVIAFLSSKGKHIKAFLILFQDSPSWMMYAAYILLCNTMTDDLLGKTAADIRRITRESPTPSHSEMNLRLLLSQYLVKMISHGLVHSKIPDVTQKEYQMIAGSIERKLSKEMDFKTCTLNMNCSSHDMQTITDLNKFQQFLVLNSRTSPPPEVENISMAGVIIESLNVSFNVDYSGRHI